MNKGRDVAKKEQFARQILDGKLPHAVPAAGLINELGLTPQDDNVAMRLEKSLLGR
jgi:hypothetical protein